MLNQGQKEALPLIIRNVAKFDPEPAYETISERVAESVICRFSSMFRTLFEESPRNGLWSVDIGCGSTGHPKYQPSLCRKISRMQKELGCTDARTVGIDIGPLRNERFEVHGDTDLRQESTVLDTLPSDAFDLVTCFGFLGSRVDDLATAPGLYEMREEDYQRLYARMHDHTRRLLREGGICLWQHGVIVHPIRKTDAKLAYPPSDNLYAL